MSPHKRNPWTPVLCAYKGHPLDEPADLPEDLRKPCPHCGTLSRIYVVDNAVKRGRPRGSTGVEDAGAKYRAAAETLRRDGVKVTDQNVATILNVDRSTAGRYRRRLAG